MDLLNIRFFPFRYARYVQESDYPLMNIPG